MELFTLEKFGSAGFRSSLAYTQDTEAVQDFVHAFLGVKPADWTWDGVSYIQVRKVTPSFILQEVFMGDRDKCPEDILAACGEA